MLIFLLKSYDLPCGEKKRLSWKINFKKILKFISIFGYAGS